MIDRVARLGLPLSIAIALAADFPWGDFQGHTHWHSVGWIPFVSPPVRPADILQNLLLFLPLGFFAALRTTSTFKGLRNAAVWASPVSFLGEWSQLYSHSRFPSATDLSSNVIGAVLGASIAWRVWSARGSRAAK